MKAPWIFAGLALLAAGCADMQLDTKADSNPNRVVTGRVELGDAGSLPDGAEVLVRVMYVSRMDYHSPTAVLGEPSTQATPVLLPPQLMGEQTIRDAQGSAIPFRVPYHATREQLSAGLNLVARVSVGGKVRFYNVDSYVLNADNAGDFHVIAVNPAGR